MSYNELIIIMIILLLFSIVLPIYCVYLSNNIEPQEEKELLIK